MDTNIQEILFKVAVSLHNTSTRCVLRHAKQSAGINLFKIIIETTLTL